jgi:hypothetical protein
LLLLLLLLLLLEVARLLLCRPCRLHNALRQHHLPGGLLNPVFCVAGTLACLPLWSPSNSCWQLDLHVQHLCIAQHMLQVLLPAVVAAAAAAGALA